MSLQCVREKLEWLTVVGTIFAAGAVAQAQEKPAPENSPRRPRIDTTLIDDTNVGLLRPWIGVVCRPVGEALHAHLDLPKDQGLLVLGVVPDGPAQAAGLQQYDILVRADKKPLAQVTDLVEVVRKSAEAPIALEIIRAGQKQSLSISPGKRPQRPGSGGEPPWWSGPGDGHWTERDMRRMFEQWLPAEPPGRAAMERARRYLERDGRLQHRLDDLNRRVEQLAEKLRKLTDQFMGDDDEGHDDADHDHGDADEEEE